MSILEELGCKKTWQEFLEHRLKKSRLSKKEESCFKNFIENELYKPVTDNILDDNYNFSIPEKRFLNKHGRSKKRVVYTFSHPENMTLKLMAFLLYRYDDELPQNCYSFRKNYGAKKAINAILKEKDIEKKFSCKLDIRDYFNSIDTELLLPILCRLLSGTAACGGNARTDQSDIPLYNFFEKLLTADRAVFNGEIITEKRGAMAGIPISGFLANIYLSEMDFYFQNTGIPYARYSDDIIFFADNREKLDEHFETVKNFLEKYHLEINNDKVKITEPFEKWDYLGIMYNKGSIGLSETTLKKIKGKIRRKARSIYRWKLRKKADDARAMRVFARVMNKKIFGKGAEDEFTWTRWFFPLITSDNDLKTIDAHVQEYMRYVRTGRFRKSNYRTSYNDLKNCGYISLVNSFYKLKSGQR